MTEKVQKIREEVARLKLCTMDEHMKFYSESAEAEYNALCKIDTYIDSLEEEPKPKFRKRDKVIYLNEEYVVEDITDHYILRSTRERTSVPVVHVGFGNEDYELRLVEEPVSEELEQEIDKYVNIPDNQGLPDLRRELSDCARHFANWQRKQDKETIELAEDHAMLAGMEKMKQQMINKACDWLKNWSYGYLIEKYGETDIDRNELVKDFKKYMEG